MKLGIHHIALEAADFNKTLAFYQDTFQMKLIRQWGNETRKTAMLDIGDGSILEIFSSGNTDPSINPKYPHIAFATENCDEAYNAAIKAGAISKMEPTDMILGGNYPVRIAFVYGLSQELIELFQERKTV